MKGTKKKQKVLFYCRCNSVSSQIAEAFLNRFFPETYEAYSAGMMASGILPEVQAAMEEIGIDLSKQRSKNVEEFVGIKFDLVALVCGNPPEQCPFLNRARESLRCNGCKGCCTFFPFFPAGKKIVHTHFSEPAARAGFACEPEGIRKLRDDIRTWVIETFG